MDSIKFYTSTEFFDKFGDPRVQLPLMRTPWPVVSMCVMYLTFVKFVGPRLMENRKPFELKSFIRAYNLLMVGWNALGIWFWCKYLNWGLDAWGCRPIDPRDRSENAMMLINVGYVFLLSRIVEFVDTICFVLRKKQRQISGFHVFHHFSVPIAVWLFVKFVPGGNSAIFPILNTIIHTIMYAYYFLATYESARPYLGWKKYLTQMQIVQFCIMIVHSTQPLFLADCKFPQTFLYINIFFSFVFIYLFADFYIKNYGQRTVNVARRLSRRVSISMQSGMRRLSFASKQINSKDLHLLQTIANNSHGNINNEAGVVSSGKQRNAREEFSQSPDTIQITRRKTQATSDEPTNSD